MKVIGGHLIIIRNGIFFMAKNIFQITIMQNKY